MKKRLFILSLLLLFFLVSCSGGSYRISVGDIDATNHELKGEYLSFTGNYFKKVKLDEGDSLLVSFHSITQKGTLQARIINSEGTVVKELSDGEIYQLNKPDHYKFEVQGQKHKGSFIISWR